MSQKGFETLKSVIAHGFSGEIDFVVGSRDKNVENDFYDAIRMLCKEAGIRHYKRHDDFKISSEYTLTVSWRWMIRDLQSRLIILHDSLLPKYRGFAPLVNMLINCEPKIGVTAIFAEEKFDTGSIICQSATEIQYPITIAEAIEKVSANYEECVLFILNQLKSGNKLSAQPQNEAEATYSLWRDEEDYFINWEHSAAEICNFINAVSSPYKGAAAMMNGTVVRILDAEAVQDLNIENRDCGKVLMMEDGYPLVVCRTGILKIKSLKDDTSGESLLPLKNFRIRFKSK